MEAITTKLTVAGILGGLTLISGVLLSNAGRPLNSILFNLHKMIAVAAIVLILISVVQLYRAGEGRAWIELGIMILAVVFFLALVATGGMLSFERHWPGYVLKVHQVLPILSLACSTISAYLLFKSRV